MSNGSKDEPTGYSTHLAVCENGPPRQVIRATILVVGPCSIYACNMLSLDRCQRVVLIPNSPEVVGDRVPSFFATGPPLGLPSPSLPFLSKTGDR